MRKGERKFDRKQLLISIYKNSGVSLSDKIQNQILDAFMLIISNWEYDPNEPIVKRVLELFQITRTELDLKPQLEKDTYLRKKILNAIDQTFIKYYFVPELVEYEIWMKGGKNKIFEWIGVETEFPTHEAVFQEFLKQKVRSFEKQFTKIIRYTDKKERSKEDIVSKAKSNATKTANSSQKTQGSLSLMSDKYTINGEERQVKQSRLRSAYSQEALKLRSPIRSWQLGQKTENNLENAYRHRKMRQKQSVLISQFSQKFVKVLSAGGNMEKCGMMKEVTSSEDLKQICSNYLFVDRSLMKTKSGTAGKEGKNLMNILEANIGLKMLDCYEMFSERLKQISQNYKKEIEWKKINESLNKEQTKFQLIATERIKLIQKKSYQKKPFQDLCQTEKMRIILNTKVLRWVKLFISNIKATTAQTKDKKFNDKFNKFIFGTKNTSRVYSSNLMKGSLKMSMLTKNRYVEDSESLMLSKIGAKSGREREGICWNKSILSANLGFSRVKEIRDLKSHTPTSAKLYLGQKEHIFLDFQRKRITMTSIRCLKLIIKIQSHWRMRLAKKEFKKKLLIHRQMENIDFIQRKERLRSIYPAGAKVDLSSLRMRIKRKSLKTNSIFQSYVRGNKVPINFYTAFCVSKLGETELRQKSKKNSLRRLKELGKMVQQNHYVLLKQSGFVLTASEINNPIYKSRASAIWWAVKNQNYRLVEIFLQGGGDPNSKNSVGDTCLHETMKNSDIKIAFLLMDYGADLNSKNENNATPLYYASPEVLKALGIQCGTVSTQMPQLQDNNLLYYKAEKSEKFYLDHYY